MRHGGGAPCHRTIRLRGRCGSHSGAVIAALFVVIDVENVPPNVLGVSAGWMALWILLTTIPGHLRARAFKDALTAAS